MQRTYHHLCFCVLFFFSYPIDHPWSSCIYMERHKVYRFRPANPVVMGPPPIRETFAAITGYKPIRLAPLASGPESRRRVDHREKTTGHQKGMCFSIVSKQVVLMIGWGRFIMFNIKVAVSTTYKVANVLILGTASASLSVGPESISNFLLVYI